MPAAWSMRAWPMGFAARPGRTAARSRRIAAPLALLAALGLPAAGALATTLAPADNEPRPPLTVCMADDNPPLSHAAGGTPRGLDVRVAEAVAAETRRTLVVVRFESKHESESRLTDEVNALLSAGVCDLASGFPLVSSDLGTPSRPTARVPDHPGAKRRALRDWVPLGTLLASRAYHVSTMGLIVRDPARTGATLAEPGDARIGVTAGTMAGTVVTLYRNGRLRPQLVSLSQNQDALAELEAGRIDATLTSLDRFDAWRLAHPAGLLRRAAYLHPLRINIGFVGLTEKAALLAAVDRVIVASLASGALERWSLEAGASWVAPAEPQIGRPIGLPDLLRE